MRLLTVWHGKDVYAGPEDDWHPPRKHTFVSVINAVVKTTSYGHDIFPAVMPALDFSIMTDRYFTVERGLRLRDATRANHVIYLCDKETADDFEEKFGHKVTIFRAQSLPGAQAHGACLKFVNLNEPEIGRNTYC